jgi:transposase InsO family protein
MLQTLFTTKELERILLEIRKNIPGAEGQPIQLQNEINLHGIPFDLPRLEVADSVVKLCVLCQLVNANPSRMPPERTVVKPAKYGNKYLLVFIDTFSSWVEAFPTRTETANVMAKKILEEIFPRFGIPKVIRSDNGPAFVAQVSQELVKILEID